MSILEKTDKAHGVPEGAKVQLVPMSEIYADEDFNCRGKILHSNVIALALSIQETGLIQPVTIRPYDKGPKGTKYQLVAGYRRHKAHIVNNMSHIKAVIVENISDVEAKIINLAENLNREDLSIMQEAKAVRELMVTGKYTQKKIAEALNRSTSWVSTRLQVLRFPKVIQEEIEAGWIKSEHIPDLAKMNDQQKTQAVKYIKDRKLNEGDRVRIRVTKETLKKDPKSKIKRGPREIQKMIDHIMEFYGACFATRCLAWTKADATTEDIYQELEAECEKEGITYFPPRHDVTME